MAVLSIKAFCDESYAQDIARDKPFVIAGYLGRARDWMEFEGYWNLALKREGLPFFHMADCENKHGEYSDMEQRERERLQRVFIGIITKFKVMGVAAGVSQDALLEARKELSKYVVDRGGRRYKIEPYLFAFELCLNRMAAYVESLPPHEQIAFVFDEQNEFEGKAHKARNLLATREEYRNRHRIVFTYDTKTKSGFVPIQAADILAYEVMRELRDPGTTRWQMAELKLGYVAEPRYYTPEMVRDHVNRLHAAVESDGVSS